MFNLSTVKSLPKEVLNWRFLLIIWAIGISGAARGLDEGIISAQTKQASFQAIYGVKYGSNMQSDITSVAQLSGVLGSIIAWLTSDKLGRIRSLQITCLVWLIGCALWMGSTANGSVPLLLVGRIISGIAVGGTVVSAPTFIVEVAPKSIRGSCNSIFSGSVYIGILLGYAVNLAASRYHKGAQQLNLTTMLNVLFAGLISLGCLFAKESPRWYLSKGRVDEAIASLSWYRQLPESHPFIAEEFEVMTEAVEKEIALRGTSAKWYDSLKEMCTSKNNLYILMLGCGVQIFGQFSGGGSVTIYAPMLFQSE